MLHKHVGIGNQCTCGYKGLHYRAVGSHIGFKNRRKGLACDVKFHFLKWNIIIKRSEK